MNKLIEKKHVIKPFKPYGKWGIYAEDGTKIEDYQIKSIKYTLTGNSFDMSAELGQLKTESVPAEFRRTIQRLEEYNMSGIRQTDDLAGGVGFSPLSITRTIIGKEQIETPHLKAGSITAEKYYELRNTYVMGDQDSLDASYPFEMDFEIVSEMTTIQSVKLSFRIREFRAYATTVPSGGGHTTPSGGGATSGATGSASGGGATSGSATHNHPGSTASGGAHAHGIGGAVGQTGETSGHFHTYIFRDAFTVEAGAHTHDLDITADGDHSHSTPNHTHPNHQHSTPNHTHTVSNHAHSLTFGIYEDSTSPNIHYHISNDGTTYGGASASYNSDQLDIDITGSISGTGFKKIRFDSDARCRISSWVLIKLDLTA